MLLNLAKSFQPLPLKDATVQQSLQHMIAQFQASIAQLKTEINQVCQADFAEQYKRLRSIKGISYAVATALIETTNGFRDFTSAKALTKFIGVAPVIYQSGKVGITKGINRSGDAHLRAQLYMASLSAIRYNKSCRECYQRLKAAGKVTNVALMAVVNNGAARAAASPGVCGGYIQ